MSSPAEDSIVRWDLPTVRGDVVQVRKPGKKRVGELEQVECAAYDEAFAAGRAAGLPAEQAATKQGLEQLQRQVAQLDAIYDCLSRPLEDRDKQGQTQLIRRAVASPRQQVRREFETDPAQLISIVRPTVGLLPAAAPD